MYCSSDEYQYNLDWYLVSESIMNTVYYLDLHSLTKVSTLSDSSLNTDWIWIYQYPLESYIFPIHSISFNLSTTYNNPWHSECLNIYSHHYNQSVLCSSI